MYQANLTLSEGIEADSRRWNLVLSDAYGHSLESQSGGVLSLTHSIETTSGAIVPGDTITQNVNIEIKRESIGDLVLKKESIISIGYGLYGRTGLVPMGKFKVYKTSTNLDTVQITLKDFFYGLNEPYRSYLTYPATLGDVVRELGEQLGWMGYEVYFPFEELNVIKTGSARGANLYEPLYDLSGDQIFVRSEGSDIEISAPPQDCNMAQALSYYAGITGFMLTQDRSGRLTCVKPSKGIINTYYRITRSKAAEPQLYSFDQDICIIGLRCNVDSNTTYISVDNTLSDPSWHNIVVDFTNPLMTSEQLDKIAEYYKGLLFRPALIDHILGDPRLDVLDRIEYETAYADTEIKDMIITSCDYNFDGGLSCNVQSPDLYQ